MTTDSNSLGRRWVSVRSLAIAQEDTTSVPHSATLTHVVADGMRFLDSISNCRTSIPRIAPTTMQALVTALARKVSCRIPRQDTMRWNMQFPDRGSGFASTEMSAGVDFTRQALRFNGGRSPRRNCPRMVSRSITATRMLHVATHLGQCSARKCRARHPVERFSETDLRMRCHAGPFSASAWKVSTGTEPTARLATARTAKTARRVISATVHYARTLMSASCHAGSGGCSGNSASTTS